MKKTLTINLNNTVFHIDDDAYELLQSYLTEVGHHFKSESEKADIMNDIEARIAELFSEKMDKQKNVITLEDVDTVITIMGKPSQFVADGDDSESYGEEQAARGEQPKSRKQKKYYRDIDNRLLGGVASGLAAYLNWDTALIRIIFVLLAFLTSGTFILIYLLMWLIIPKAETTSQKLEMQGEDVNIETIKNKMVDAKEYLESDKFKAGATEAGTRIWEIIRVFLKVILSIVGAIISIVGVILIAALIFGLIVFLLEPEAITSIFPEFFSAFGVNSPDKIILLIISLLLIIGAPIFALINWSMNVISKKQKERPYSGLIVALILWLAGIFMFVGTGADTLKNLRKNNIITNDWELNYNTMPKNENYITENRTVEDFTSIQANGAIAVELTQQTEQTLSVSTLSEYLPNIKTEVTDGVLKLYSVDRLINPRIKVRIGVDSISVLEANGASKIDFMNSFNVKNLNIRLQGASKSDIKLNSAQKLDIKLSGASKMDASGVTDTLLIEAAGASKIDADVLRAKIVKIDVGGASNSEVYASDEFDGEANGASKITVLGNPSKRSNTSSGGSSIKYE